jgi:hypothetical protein
VIDLFLHEGHIKAPYGFLLYSWFLAILKFAADISLLAGTHWVVSRHLFDRVQRAKAWLLAGDFLILTLLVMALYYLCSLLASQILWLLVGDLDTLNEVSGHRNDFQAAYSAIQMLVTVLIVLESLVAVWCEWNEDRLSPTPKVSLNGIYVLLLFLLLLC